MTLQSNLQNKLQRIQQRIENACQAAHRSKEDIKLLAVSKTFPHTDVLTLLSYGQTAFGENYLQEALDKITHVADERVEWHFIGPIQSNKTRLITEHFQWVHSLDRLKIAERLSAQRPKHLSPLNVLVQINTSGEISKAGLKQYAPSSHLKTSQDQLLQFCQTIQQLPNLTLRGLMTLPNPNVNTQELRKEFMQCTKLFQFLKTQLSSNQFNNSKFDTLSMGMSSDLELAIDCGSTCVRVGSALFGTRR